MGVKNFVVDTNVLVSAFIFNSRNPREVIEYCLSTGKIVASSDTTEELRFTLLAEKFEPFVPKATRETLLSLFVGICEIVTPTKKIAVCRDADDDKFLELAIEAKARCIITGDPDLLALNPFENIPIITPKEFLDRYS
jgi:hypothetical protein